MNFSNVFPATQLQSPYLLIMHTVKRNEQGEDEMELYEVTDKGKLLSNRLAFTLKDDQDN